MADLFEPEDTVETSAQHWPNNQSLRNQLSMPVTLSLYPLSPGSPLASFSGENIGQYRCHSCKAFINHLCTIKNQKEYDCSICGCSNRLSREISEDSVEMRSHVYECTTKSLTNRTIQNEEQTYAFLVDVSNYSKTSHEFLRYTTYLISEFARQRKQHTDVKILLIAFDNSIYYYFKEEDGEIGKLKNTHLQQMNIQNYFFSAQNDADLIQQILNDMEHQFSINQSYNKIKLSKCQAFMSSIHEALRLTQGFAGRMFLVSGGVVEGFEKSLNSEPENWRDNFTLNMKKCIPANTLQLMNRSQISINIYIYNTMNVSILPLYVMTKITNGIVRLYHPSSYEMFFYELQSSLCLEAPFVGTQSVLKVRSTTGLKLVGIFGQYRTYKNLTDQIEMISCPSTRRYVFQFIIEGKIHQPFVNVQFSILSTDQYGNRNFKIVTYQNKITSDEQLILSSINYNAVCNSYIQAVFHNMDLNTTVRNLQLALQERCRKHLLAIKKYLGDLQKHTDKVRPYIVLSFLLMRHFILNSKPENGYLFDQAVEMRSRSLTSDEAMHIVWPVVYSVNSDSHSIIEMKKQQIQKSEVGVVTNQGDFCYVYIVDEDIRKKVISEKKETNEYGLKIIQQYDELQQMVKLIKQLKNDKVSGYISVTFLDNYNILCVLDEKGQFGFNNFLNAVMDEK